MPEAQRVAVGGRAARPRPARRRSPTRRPVAAATSGADRPGSRRGRRRRARSGRRSSRRRDPGQHGVAGRRGHLGRRCSPSTSTRKNGLPPVSRCSSSGRYVVPSARRRTPAADSGGRSIRRVQRWPVSSPSATRSGVGGRQRVVAEGDDQQHRQVAQPAPQEAEQVEGRVVGPLHVLDDQHGQAVGVAEPAAGRRRTPSSRGSAGADRVEQGAADLAGDVVQRRERSRREQAVAGAPGPGGVAELVLELLDEGGLADAGLAGDQHQAPGTAARLVGVLAQRGELRLPFEQGHVGQCAPSRRRRPRRSGRRTVRYRRASTVPPWIPIT